jgi:hypothetical protein
MSIHELEDGLAALYKKVYDKKVFLNTMAYFKEIQKKLIIKGT